MYMCMCIYIGLHIYLCTNSALHNAVKQHTTVRVLTTFFADALRAGRNMEELVRNLSPKNLETYKYLILPVHPAR